MSPLVAYILGLLTILVPFLIFYVLSLNYKGTSQTWDDLFCS